MKRIFCIFLALLLCLTLFSCQKEVEEVEEPDEDYDAPIVLADDSERVSGKILEKVEPDILVIRPTTKEMKEKYGYTAHVVTDEADEWCVDDEISVSILSVEYSEDSSQYTRIIAGRIKELETFTEKKPIIYLYPESPTQCTVKLSFDGKLTCTYPDYGADGWQNFTAYPDGTLIFPDGKEYYALYWEGEQSIEWDFTQGFCVQGEDTAEFLEWALAAQGLTPREANEFIMYWLPIMQDNPYNVISFQTTAYTDAVGLEISPAPDSLLRVFMTYYATDAQIEIEPQSFAPFARQGFTVVEWGGTQVRQ